MLRLIGFILKNDDDELEAHPVSTKSTSTKLKAFLLTVALKIHIKTYHEEIIFVLVEHHIEQTFLIMPKKYVVIFVVLKF